MLADDTGSGVPRPPTDTAVAPDAFDVVWHPNYTTYPDCTSTNVVVFNSPVPGFPLPFSYPYPVTPPAASWCARQGGAGDYVANESAYRNTLLRDTLGLTIPAGHISTPVMTRFLTTSTNVITDSMFESYRSSIVQQGRNLVFSVARNTNAAPTPLVAQPAPYDTYIWPNQVGPGSEALTSLKLTLQERSTDASINDRAVTGVTRPTLTVYAPLNPSGVAIVVAPGGGYSHETIDKEGTDVAWAFNPIGVTVFVLTYRMPSEGHADREDVPLEDGQRAMRFIRANASQWHLDPAKIGIMGFSAGGHLAGALGTLYDKATYAPVDNADSISARPDFMVLLYPVITMDLTFGEPGTRTSLLGSKPTAAQITQWSVENWVTSNTPPAFVAMAANDGTVNPPHNGILFSQKLAAAGVATELHEFPLGGHGFGIRGAIGEGLTWPVLAQRWMASIGMK
jgi:acetyl esterase/lipase